MSDLQEEKDGFTVEIFRFNVVIFVAIIVFGQYAVLKGIATSGIPPLIMGLVSSVFLIIASFLSCVSAHALDKFSLKKKFALTGLLASFMLIEYAVIGMNLITRGSP